MFMMALQFPTKEDFAAESTLELASILDECDLIVYCFNMTSPFRS